MEKQHCTAWHVSFLSLCNHKKNAKPKSLSCRWYFKRSPGLKGERKISSFSFICFVLLFFFKAGNTLRGLYNQRFQGRRCAFSCRKSEDTKGDGFATSAVGRSCVLCYLGIVFDQVRNTQRRRASVDFEAGMCWHFLDRLTSFSKFIVSLEAALPLDHEFLRGSWTYLHNPRASSVVF